MTQSAGKHHIDIHIEWDGEDKSHLASALKGQTDPDRIAPIIAQAGANEVLSMATGDHVPETLAGLHQYRIFCLIRAGMTLNETEHLVASIFKLTPTAAKRRVNAAVARFSVDLSDQIADAIRGLLEGAVWIKEDSGWEVRIPWEYVRERITDELNDLDLPRPSRTARGSLWAFADETYQAMRELYDLPERHHSEWAA
jgi:hypothetical protein